MIQPVAIRERSGPDNTVDDREPENIFGLEQETIVLLMADNASERRSSGCNTPRLLHFLLEIGCRREQTRRPAHSKIQQLLFNGLEQIGQRILLEGPKGMLLEAGCEDDQWRRL